MKKKVWLTACILACTAWSSSFAATSRALFPAKADAAVQTPNVQDVLLAPASYEEYLPLHDPQDVCLNERYTAIAERYALYIFDRMHECYHQIDVTAFTSHAITKIQFADASTLFVLDADMRLYQIDVTTNEVTAIERPCSTFLIHGDWLFYTTSSGGSSKLWKTTVSEPTQEGILLGEDLHGSPALAFWNDELYYTDESHRTHLYKLDPNTAGSVTPMCEFTDEGVPFKVAAMSIADNTLACTIEASAEEGAFYTYALTDLKQPPQKTDGDFSALVSFGDFFYTVKGDIVKEYAVDAQTFTDYEICAASDHEQRLNGATAACMANELLFIADNGNKRISVYDTQTAQFQTPIATDVTPTYISAYNDALLVAGTTQAVLYDLSPDTYGQAVYRLDALQGNVIGVTSIYGTHYVVTESNCFYAIAKNEDGAWSVRITQKNITQYPTLITSDVYGILYALCGNDVYAFTEETAMQPGGMGTYVQSFPATIGTVTQLYVDYQQNVYALADNAVHTATQTFTFDSPLVYYANPAQNPTVQAFGFNVLENKTYVLCDNTYVLQTQRLQLPTVKTIAVNDVDKKIFEKADAEFSVLQTNANALLVEFDVQTLSGATHFPYLATERTENKKTALKIGETESHYLIAHYNQTSNRYQTYLVRKQDCSPLSADVYRTDYAQDERKNVFITSDVQLYKFPYLTNLLTVTLLPRGCQVTVLGEIKGLDHTYYHVQYTQEDGTVHTGYIPQAFTNTYSGLPPQSETYETPNAGKATNETWRLVYLLLGFSLICVLTDWLLLRDNKNNDEETR